LFWFLKTRKRVGAAQLGPTLGLDSQFTLLKLGFDLRKQYHELVSEPLPNAMHQVAMRLTEGNRAAAADECFRFRASYL
jgi:hypothetical protein